MILVTGSLAFDLIMDFPGQFADSIDPQKLHILNISFLVNSLKKERGGTAGNIAYSLGLLKIPVSILASAGDDFLGYKAFLDNHGVDTSNILQVPNESTAMAFIVTDKDDNQITGFYPGAMKNAGQLSLKKLKPKPSLVVIAPDNPQAMVNYVKECQRLKIPYLFDPGMQLPRLSDQELERGISRAEILIGNDYEIGLIKKRLDKSDKQLLKGIKILITTLGAKGSIVKTQGQEFNVSAASPRVVVDPTGAGDAFRAGFLAGYTKGFDLTTCAQMGSVTACYVVEKYGTSNHKFTLEEFTRRYRRNFGELPKLI